MRLNEAVTLAISSFPETTSGGTFFFALADEVSALRHNLKRANREPVNTCIDGKNPGHQGENESHHDAAKSLVCDLQGHGHGYRNDLGTDQFVELPPEAIGGPIGGDHGTRCMGGNAVAFKRREASVMIGWAK